MQDGKKVVRIVAFGDSITYAVGNAGNTEADSYCFKLQEALNARLTKAVEVINAGLNADTTDGAVERIARDVLPREPDHVIVMYGVNDAGFFRPDGPPADTPRVAKSDFAANLRSLAKTIRAAGAEPVFATPVPMNEAYWLADLPAYVANGLNYLVADYAQMVRDAASHEAAGLVDVYDAFHRDPGSAAFVPDGLHPGPEGQSLIAKTMARYFVSALGR